jgi:hypothetical protein
VTIPEKGDLDCLRPKQSSEKNQMEDGEEERAFPFPEPQRPEHPGKSQAGDPRGWCDSCPGSLALWGVGSHGPESPSPASQSVLHARLSGLWG